MKKKILSLAFVLLLSLVLSGCTREEEPTDNYTKGLQHVDAQEYSDALKAFSDATDETPSVTDIYIQMAEIYKLKGVYDKALEVLEMGIANASDNKTIYFQQGEIYFLSKEYENAIESYDKAIKNKYADDQPLYKKGLSYIKLSDFDNAKNVFAGIASPDELKNKARYYLAVLEIEDIDAAIKHLTKVTTTDDKDFESNVSLLKSVFTEENEKSGEEDVNENYLKLLHGYALIKVEEFEVAKVVIEPVADYYEELGKPSYQANFYLGSIYYNLDNYDKALEELTTSIVSNPTDPITLHLLGLTYAKKDNQLKSLENFEKSIKLDSKNENARYDYIETLKKFKVYSTAETQYDALIALETDRQPQYIIEFAQFLNDLQGKPESSAPKTEDLITEWSGFKTASVETKAEIYDTHGWSLNLMETPKEALEYLLLAKDSDETLASTYYHLGKTYEALGNYDEAISNYARAIDLALTQGLSVKANQEYERLLQ